MALKYASMMNMTKCDLIGLCGDLNIEYPQQAPTKFQMCLDIAKFKTELNMMEAKLEDVSADIGHRA